MRKILMALTITGFLGGLPVVQASPGHDHDGGMKHDDHGGMKHDDHAGMKHGDHDGMQHEDHGGSGHKMDGMFLEKKQIDGYLVSFHVMKPVGGPSMGGSHHVMIKVERDGKPVDGIVMNTKVVFPDGKDETKKAMKMGDWYMAGYDMQDGKKHQLMILFKTADGKKHKGGVYYQ